MARMALPRRGDIRVSSNTLRFATFEDYTSASFITLDMTIYFSKRDSSQSLQIKS